MRRAVSEKRLLHWTPAVASRETSTTAAKLRQLGQRKARLSSYAQRDLKPLAATREAIGNVVVASRPPAFGSACRSEEPVCFPQGLRLSRRCSL